MYQPTCTLWPWVEPLATFLGIVVGAWMIKWQQAESARASLKLGLFENLRKGLDVASSAAGEAAQYLRAVPLHYQIFGDLRARGERGTPPSARFPHFLELNSRAMHRVAELMILLEAHDIVSEHFEWFRAALRAASHDAQDRFQKLVPLAVRTLPVDVSNLPDQVTAGLTDDNIAALTPLVNAYYEAMSELSDYIYDIQMEAQNLLLSGLFDRKAKRRAPPDPKRRVLSVEPENAARLRKYFMEEHPAAQTARAWERVAAAQADTAG